MSGQSGTAYLADLLAAGVSVYGYARETPHGRQVVDALRRQGGIRVERPEHSIEPPSRFVPLVPGAVGHDLARLLDVSEVLVLSHPAVYHEETARLLAPALLARRPRIPLVLSPSRTLATPYLWGILGDGYPIVSLQTCPMACKAFEPGSVYIKRRKRVFVGVLEGDVPDWLTAELGGLFPQAIFGTTPAAASLGNVGAVLHPATYLMNLEAIRAAARRGEAYSFYVDGLGHSAAVGSVVERVDQFRLDLARAVGVPVFGAATDPRDGEWQRLVAPLRDLPAPTRDNLFEVRRQRARLLGPLRDAVVSVPLWLEYTYGLDHAPGESVADAIARTPTFQDRSYPQARYADEDVPTGLVPFEALAQRFGIDAGPVTELVDLYERASGIDIRAMGRNLASWSTSWLHSYLRGPSGVQS